MQAQGTRSSTLRAVAPSASLRTMRVAMRGPTPVAGASRPARSVTARVQVVAPCASLNHSSSEFSNDNKPVPTERDTLRMAIPSKGRMAEDTIDLFRSCNMKVIKPNPRQYVAKIAQLPELEVWFQRASDVVRKLRYGDFDIGIVGYDMFAEFAEEDPDLVVVHNALDFGQCRLSLGVPMGGDYTDVNTLEDLKNMGWTEEKPLRVVTGYTNIARRYFKEKGFEHVRLLSADGALEAQPAMGSADIILDLVSTGVTLRENNLKELQDGGIMHSEGVLVANRNSLLDRPGLLEVVHELVERFDAHLKAGQFYSVVANIPGNSAEEVASKLMSSPELKGLQGPTINPVYTQGADGPKIGMYACVVCVPKKSLYPSVKQLRALGGTGVLVQPMIYIFDEEPQRWDDLLDNLGLEKSDYLHLKTLVRN